MRIAHISDLHLLDLEGAVPRRIFNKRFTGWVNIRLNRGHTHKPTPVHAAGKAFHDVGVDHVVVTGDLTNLALERALADVVWLRARLARVEEGERMTVQDWARDAVAWASLEFSYATVRDGPASVALENSTIAALHGHDLWNRRR